MAGRVHSVRVPTRTDTANLECTLADGTGSILLVFQGRRQVPGLHQGARLVAEGMVGAWMGRPAMLNPDYELLAGAEASRQQHLFEAVTASTVGTSGPAFLAVETAQSVTSSADRRRRGPAARALCSCFVVASPFVRT